MVLLITGDWEPSLAVKRRDEVEEVDDGRPVHEDVCCHREKVRWMYALLNVAIYVKSKEVCRGC